MSGDCVEFCKALGEIAAAFSVSQPTISHHLSVLRQLDLVTARREGQPVYYALNRDRMVECCGRLVARFATDEGACRE